SGVTTVQHLHGWRVAPAARVRAIAERILQAYEDIGMRVSYSYALRDQNRLVYEADEDFLRRLPAELAADVAAWFPGPIIPLGERPGLFAWRGGGRGGSAGGGPRIRLPRPIPLGGRAGPLGALRPPPRRYGVGMHMHLLETAYQKEYARRRTGTSAARHLAD